MDAATLMASMTYPDYPLPLSAARYAELAPGATQALQRAACTTVRRAAAFLAQVGAESGSLRWTEELADGTAYDRYLNPGGPWSNLGNTEAGDGARFKGRTFIQITGRSHYRNLGRWAHQHAYVPDADYFLDHPAALASDQYVWLGPVWYWTVARPQINSLADAGDIDGVTYAVNGGYNNAAGRRARWNKCLTLGSALLAGATPTRNGAAVMFEIVRDAKTHAWYAWAPGYWRRLTATTEIAALAASALCANRAAVQSILKTKDGTRARINSLAGVSRPHSTVDALRVAALNAPGK